MDFPRRSLVTLPGAVALALVGMTAHAAQRVDLHALDVVQLNHQYKMASAGLPSAPSPRKRHEEMLGLDASSTLQQLALSRDADGTVHYRYQQRFRGIPIFGEQVVVSEDASGNVRNLFGRAVSGLANELPAVPVRLTRAQALSVAKTAALGKDGVAKRTERDSVRQMVYVDSGRRAHMSYVASFFAESVKGGAPTRPFVVVDAQTGRVLTKWEGLTTSRVGMGPGGNAKTGEYKWGERRSLGSMDVLQTGSTCAMENADVKSVNLAGGTGASTTAFSFVCPTNTYRTVNGAYSPINDAHSFGGMVQKMYKAWTGSNALTFQLVMRVHYGTSYENAFWDGTQMNFGDGGSHFYPLVSADVSGHEVSHGFTEQHSNLLYFGQSGGINEAFSDMGGEATEYYWKGRNDFIVGAEIVKGSGGLRYMCNPTADGTSIDNAADFSSTLNVHYSSGVYNKAFCNLAHTKGWDTPTAFKAFARANALYWTPSSTFDSAACGVQTAAADLGLGADAVKAAFAGVGVSCTTSSAAQGNSVGGPLTKGVKVTDISAADGTSVVYTLDVPVGAGHLVFAQWGGLGDADLYVKLGSPPTDSSYDCRPYASGNGETCVFAEPLAGTYYVRIKAYASYSRVSLENNYVAAIPINSGDRVSLAPQSGVSLSPTYALSVPAGKGSVTFRISGGTGYADMYVQRDGTPSSKSTLCVPDTSTNEETCRISTPAAGTYFVNVRAEPAFSDVTLKANVGS